MPRQEVYHLHPRGWETDPEDEYFPLSTLDYLAAQMWCNYALFFKLSPASTPALSLPVEKEIVPGLLADPEWSEVFDFRGVEMDEEEEEEEGGSKSTAVEDVGGVRKQAAVEMETAIVVDPVAM